MKRAAREFIALFAASLSGIVVLFLVGAVGYQLISRLDLALYAALTAAALVAASLAAWWFTRRKLSLPRLSTRTLKFLASAYAITWTLGGPQVHTDLAASEIAQYKRLKAEGDNRVWDSHPKIQFYVSFPVAPAVMLTYHEYQIAGLWGEGAWELRAWYFLGTRRIIGMGTWIS